MNILCNIIKTLCILKSFTLNINYVALSGYIAVNLNILNIIFSTLTKILMIHPMQYMALLPHL